MTNLEGKIHIDLTVENGRIKTDIRSQRPVLACRVFEQKTTAQALPLVPMLFSLCGQAQSVAAVRAIESAVNTPASEAVEMHRELLIQLESLREHLWRMSIDWPALLGMPSATSIFAPINQTLGQLQQFLNVDGSLNRQPGAQDVVTNDELTTEWENLRAKIDQGYLSATDTGPGYLTGLLLDIDNQKLSKVGNLCFEALPNRDNAAYADALRNGSPEQFIAQPTWGKRCYETGPFARHQKGSVLHQVKESQSSGLYARFLARVVETEQLLAQLDSGFNGDIDARYTPAENGISQVEAVRGRLVHSVELDGEIITRYRILAPTEWNFHPQGIAAQMLSTLSTSPVEELEKHARLIIHAIDPCVGYELNIGGDI